MNRENRYLVCFCSGNNRRYVWVHPISDNVEWTDVSVPDSTIVYFLMRSEASQEKIEKSFLSIRFFNLESFGFQIEESTRIDNDTVYVVGRPCKNGAVFDDDSFIPFDDGGNIWGCRVIFS